MYWNKAVSFKSLSSYLSCSPDTVHMLRAEPALCSQEIQDHLALLNDLENTQTHTLKINNSDSEQEPDIMYIHIQFEF